MPKLLLLTACCLALAAEDIITAKVGSTLAPDGKTELHLDLPAAEHRRNIESRGQGCCVQTSINQSARWQHIPALIDFHEWVRSKGLPGGAYPAAIDQRIPACCKDRGHPPVSYLQVDGKHMEIRKRACQTGRMPGVTYSFSPTRRYSGQRIAHMVSLVHSAALSARTTMAAGSRATAFLPAASRPSTADSKSCARRWAGRWRLMPWPARLYARPQSTARRTFSREDLRSGQFKARHPGPLLAQLVDP